MRFAGFFRFENNKGLTGKVRRKYIVIEVKFFIECNIYEMFYICDIIFFLCGFGFTVRHKNLSRTITVEYTQLLVGLENWVSPTPDANALPLDHEFIIWSYLKVSNDTKKYAY